MVRGVGPRVPVRAVRARRSGVREGPALDAAVRAVPASERPAARVRVGVRRSQPARARVGGVARLQHGSLRNGKADRDWLERCFHKLLVNFASWVNKVDHDGNNVFEGGFLGLDNITVIDRSEPSAGRLDARASRTRPAGWACSASTSCGSRSSSRRRTTSTRRWRRSSSSTTSYVARRDEAHGRPRPRAVRRAGRLLLRRARYARRQLPASSACARSSA